jgi:hypothetical protein
MRDGTEIKTGGRRHIRIVLTMFIGLSLVIIPAFAAPDPGGENVKLPSENTAFLFSLIGTVVPVGYGILARGVSGGSSGHGNGSLYVAWLGALVGPSLGYIYGGRAGRGLLGLVGRAAVVIIMAGIMLSNDEANNTFVGLAGVGLFAGSALFDLISVRKAVRKHNDAARARKGMSVSVAPFFLRREKGAGLNIGLSF